MKKWSFIYRLTAGIPMFIFSMISTLILNLIDPNKSIYEATIGLEVMFLSMYIFGWLTEKISKLATESMAKEQKKE